MRPYKHTYLCSCGGGWNVFCNDPIMMSYVPMDLPPTPDEIADARRIIATHQGRPGSEWVCQQMQQIVDEDGKPRPEPEVIMAQFAKRMASRMAVAEEIRTELHAIVHGPVEPPPKTNEPCANYPG